MMRLQWTSADDAAPGPSGRVGAPSQLAATRRTRRRSRRRGKASRSASWDDHTATQHSSGDTTPWCRRPVTIGRPREHPQSPNILAFRLIGPPKKPQNEPVRSSLASWLGVARGFGRCIKRFGQPEVPQERMPRHHCCTLGDWACLSYPIPTYMTVSVFLCS